MKHILEDNQRLTTLNNELNKYSSMNNSFSHKMSLNNKDIVTNVKQSNK